MTPLKDYYNEKISKLDKENKFKDISKLEIGNLAYVKGTSEKAFLIGFVKKIARVNVTLETTYGGWGGSDIILQELKVKKNEITQFVKPLK